MEKLSNELVIEILLRLPLVSLALLKSTSRSLHRLISDPFFIALYSCRSTMNVSGLLYITLRENCDVHHIPFGFSGISNHNTPHTSLGSSPFLERGPVSILASCNGLIFLCTLNTYFVYDTVASKYRLAPKLGLNWLGILSNKKKVFGLVFDPLIFPSSYFKILWVLRSGSNSHVYVFKIFSLENDFWKITEGTFCCTSHINYFNFENFALPVYNNGLLYWLSESGIILAFDVGKKEGQMIDIPENMTIRSQGEGIYWDACLGVVKGVINFASVSDSEIAVWALQDQFKWQITMRVETTWSTCDPLFFNGERILVGRCNSEYPKSFEVHQYNTGAKEWKKIHTLQSWMKKNNIFVPYADQVYVVHFKCNKKLLSEYPNLFYTEDIFQIPRMSSTVNMEHIKQHYYGSHPSINPFGIILVGPDMDYSSPHEREKFTT